MAKVMKEEASKEVAAKSEAPVAVDVGSYNYGDHKRSGFENQTGADILIPLLLLLQDLSPQTKKNKSVYVEGAEPGMMMNSATGELYPAPLIFVPVYTTREFIEWVDRDHGGGDGKGFRGVHSPESEVVARARAMVKGQRVAKLIHPDEPHHNLVETFTMYGYTLDNAQSLSPSGGIAIPFSSTKITPYKKINTRMSNFRGAPDAPLYAHRLAIYVTHESRQKGDSYNFSVEAAINDDIGLSLIPPTLDGKEHPLLAHGAQLKKVVESGQMRAAHEHREQDGDESVPTGPDGKSVF